MRRTALEYPSTIKPRPPLPLNPSALSNGVFVAKVFASLDKIFFLQPVSFEFAILMKGVAYVDFDLSGIMLPPNCISARSGVSAQLLLVACSPFILVTALLLAFWCLKMMLRRHTDLGGADAETTHAESGESGSEKGAPKGFSGRFSERFFARTGGLAVATQMAERFARRVRLG